MKKIFLMMGIWLLLVGGAWAQNDQVLSWFVEGNNAYKSADYAGAIVAFEKITASGVVSGAVYYNLGNSYYKKGELGKALLNYERARRLMPRDSDLEANWEYANSLVKKSTEDIKHGFWARAMNHYLLSFSLGEWACGVWINIFVLAVVHLLSLWLNWNKVLSRWLVATLLLLAVVHGGLLWVKLNSEGRFAVVLKEEAARFEPRAEATKHFDLYEGAKVEVIRAEGSWVKIRRLDKNLGWVPKATVERI